MKHTLLTALLAVGAVVANAATLTPEAALARASELMPRSTRPAAPSTIRPDLKLTLAADGQPTVYVFANGTRGYLVAAADDACPALLGYSDKDKFSGEAMAPALQYWLQEYSRQVAYARTQSNTVKVPAKARPVRAAIAPMVATRWNQDAPFNNDCPVINGERSVTGCVATALAQVMKYHNWPEHGTSSHSYTYNGQTISADFAKTTYDWANMRDVYTSSATAAQNAAVATLMFNCGVAVDMQYTAQESSSASFSVPAALINYFNYDKGVRYIPRDLYGLYDWEDLVYENLVTYGPVQYSGQSESGGHSFVCDGYSSDGYFHINWGWGGMSDGYFLLTALDPETQGIGGSTSGYNYAQDIIYGVTTPKADSKVYEQMFGTTSMTLSAAQTTLGSGLYIEMEVMNATPLALSSVISLKFKPVAGGDSIIATGARFSQMPSGAALSSWEVGIPSSLAAGEYSVIPCFRTSDGLWRDIPSYIAYAGTAKATVNGNIITFSQTRPSIAVSDVEPQTPFYIGTEFNVKATVENTGATEYYGGVALALVDSTGTVVGLGATYPLDIMAGESADIDYVSAFSAVNGATLSAGTHYICFMDPSTGTRLSDFQEIELADAESTSMRASAPVVANASSVDPQKMQVTSEVTVSSGFFGGALTLVIFPYSTSSVTSVGSLPGQTVFLQGGDTQTVTFSGAFSAGESGKQYMCGVFYGSTQISPVTIFTVDIPSGVEDITAEADAKPVYYNLNGVRVTNPVHGQLLIRITAGKAQKVIY